MLEFAEVLEQYFLKHGKRDNYIWTINLLGGIHNAMPERQDGEKAAWYFQKIRSFKDCYFEIENDDVRKRIIYSFYNYAIVKINFSIIDPLNPNEIAQAVDDALDFYNDEQFMNYINTSKSKSIYDFKVDVKFTDKILTLSTCSGNNRRLVVQAVLINE